MPQAVLQERVLICFVVLPCEPFSCETGYWRLSWFYIFAHFTILLLISLHFISMWSAHNYLYGFILSHFMVLILWNHLWYIAADTVGFGFECLSSPWIRARSDWSMVLFSDYLSLYLLFSSTLSWRGCWFCSGFYWICIYSFNQESFLVALWGIVVQVHICQGTRSWE